MTGCSFSTIGVMIFSAVCSIFSAASRIGEQSFCAILPAAAWTQATIGAKNAESCSPMPATARTGAITVLNTFSTADVAFAFSQSKTPLAPPRMMGSRLGATLRTTPHTKSSLNSVNDSHQDFFSSRWTWAGVLAPCCTVCVSSCAMRCWPVDVSGWN